MKDQVDNVSDKNSLIKRITSLEQALGLEKRMKANPVDQCLAELDMKPMNSESFDIQNILFDYCGINFSPTKYDDE